MSSKAIAFRARARTIDHLGKGQIADCPTAVSELWKNSYDAYARDVALHTYDGVYKCGAIIDNGCGMTMTQFIESWLVVGTESKSKKGLLPDADRFGLPVRSTQGEKGIGRLSSAFLAPVTLLVTKKVNTQYTAALIDWRLFENTYLSLADINVPITEFNNLAELPSIFEQLIPELKKNLCIAPRADISDEHQAEIRDAWDKFGYDQIAIAERMKEDIPTTEERITRFCDSFVFNPDITETWQNLLEKVEVLDGEKHGTALFLLDLARDLALLTNPGAFAKENNEVTDIEKDLVNTLRAFIDPFDDHSNSFNYEIKSFLAEKREKSILRQADTFTEDDFANLEHTVVGEFDNRGWFTGNVKAFGIDKGLIKIPPSLEVEATGTKVGGFKVKIGSFEDELPKSSLSQTQHETVVKQKKYAGLMVFRDGLRVLPYGRADNDFFEIEENRSKNASRYYWSQRRMFGKISITQEDNILLKDKAGREGFIRNQAARELKVLISDFLKGLADRYFGRNSDDRKEMLAIVAKERAERKEAQTQARKQSQKSFVAELRQKTPELEKQLAEVRKIQETITETPVVDIDVLVELDQNLQKLEAERVKLKPPVKPPKLGDNEEKYRLHRDMYSEFSAHLVELKEFRNRYTAELSRLSPVQTAKKDFERKQSILSAQVNRHYSAIEKKVNLLLGNWAEEVKADRSKYNADALPVLEGVENGSTLESALNSLEVIFTNLSDTFTVKYEAILRSLDRLEQGVNLDSAFSIAEEERVYFEEKAKSLQALAQLGISVEIMAHELEELDAMVTSGLNSLPSDVKSNHPGYKTAYNAHKALTQQIRFLSPLKLSGYQLRRDIAGVDIKDHVEKFFRDRFTRQRVNLHFGDDFLRMHIKDLPSRIYPVFVNLVNNAMYWVCLGGERHIIIDVIGPDVVIANSGPPVDEEDVPRLFELFYSRRTNGNGVGLYLCKENLAVAHHRIRYATPGDAQLLPDGANFAITFNNMEIL